MNRYISLMAFIINSWLVLPLLSYAQSITDADGNVYKTIKIGDQTWMAQNLSVSKFRNGDLIPEAKTDEAWEKATMDKKPAWCNYEFNTDLGVTFGKLYNCFAVNDSRGIAPKGWHIQSDRE